MSDAHNRRQFQRISFDAPVEISQGRIRTLSKVVDISLKGFLVKTPDVLLDISQPVQVSIHLGDTVQIQMTAEWASERNGCMAFSWTHVDIESLMHLRRLLELNTGDEALMERELLALGGAEE